MIDPAFAPGGRRSISAAMFAVVAIANPAPSSATSSVSKGAAAVRVMRTNATDESRQPAMISDHARRERYSAPAGIRAASDVSPYTEMAAPITTAATWREWRDGGARGAKPPPPSGQD